ncbi:hypothetical protein [Ralstonia sp. 24A2]|uniref:hypothetical protein n=1 Tax=Ralstonia sp. 24A2 TaxID=3447364 RepID=UPI003F69AF06
MTAVVSAAVMLTACGGGGDGGNPDMTVSYGTSSLTAKAFQGQQLGVNAFQDPMVTVQATVFGSASGTVYARVLDSGQGFGGSPLSVSAQGSGRYSANLKANAALVPGTYTGTLTLQLCKDAGCSSQYTTAGAALPYTVTITPRLSVDVYVNGMFFGTTTSGPGLTVPAAVPNNSNVEFRSNIPVQWRYSSGPGFIGVTVNQSSTSTDWKATLVRPANASTDFIGLSAVTQDSSQFIQRSADVSVRVLP